MDITVYDKKTGEIAFICSCEEQHVQDNYDPATQNFILGHYRGQDGYIDVKSSEFVDFPPKPSDFYTFDWKTKAWVYQNAEQVYSTYNDINTLAGVKITFKYPIYAQLNIGRTPEAQVMYDWIDSVRALADEYRSKVEVSTSESQIDSLFAEYKAKLAEIQ